MMFSTRLVLPALLTFSTPSLAAVKDFTTKNFDSSVFAGTPSLVEFFAPWCGHCKRLAPIYEELGDHFSHASKKVLIGRVDGDEHKDLSQKFGIGGFPTLKWFDGKSKEPEDYKGGRDLESLEAFITEKTGQKPKKPAQAPSEVEHLTDKTFTDAVGKEKDVLVAFTAPWCGHCKSLAPTWEKVAADFSAENNIVVAKVDAEVNKAVAEAQGVKSYPTIKFFPKGSAEAEAYSGAREEADFLSYINEKTGAHRIVGGGLDKDAGTIEALDSLVSSLSVKGKNNLDTVSAEVKKAATGLKDKYAEYYVKALGKLEQNKEYLDKETARLESLLSKGGLARAKEDDLTSRLNILNRFGLDGDQEETEADDGKKEEL